MRTSAIGWVNDRSNRLLAGDMQAKAEKRDLQISVVVVNWNAGAYIRDCLESISRDLKSLRGEIIVVDNGSTDGSQGLIRRDFPHVKLVETGANLGFARANNIGIRSSAGHYLCLVNPDVKLVDGCILSLHAFAEREGLIGIIGPKIIDSDGSVKRSCMEAPTLWNTFGRAFALERLGSRASLQPDQLMTNWSYDTVRSVQVINGCFWFVRRSSLSDVGLLDERFFIYGEDIDWCIRFAQAGWGVVFYPEAAAIHYGGGSSAHAPIASYLELQRANWQLWRKYHSPLSQIVYLVLLYAHHTVRVAGHGLSTCLPRSKSRHSLHKVRCSWAALVFLTFGKSRYVGVLRRTRGA